MATFTLNPTLTNRIIPWLHPTLAARQGQPPLQALHHEGSLLAVALLGPLSATTLSSAGSPDASVLG